ncbi:MAG: hypothetical protein AAF236_07545 [Verrucomicrobiota bacterium]
MMHRKNRYKNRIGALAICRLVLAGALLLASGGGFVLVRNSHIIKGDEIHEVEMAIEDLEEEIELWEVRIAGVRDRQELSRRLRWVQSDLEEIDSNRLVEMSAPVDETKPVVGLYR